MADVKTEIVNLLVKPQDVHPIGNVIIGVTWSFWLPRYVQRGEWLIAVLALFAIVSNAEWLAKKVNACNG